MARAQRGIHFITPDYNEKFRIPDGDEIRVTAPDGESHDYECRYIDDYHFELDGACHNLYHIAEFAERMERNGNTIIPLRSSLPEYCHSVLPTSGELILISRETEGYMPPMRRPMARRTRSSRPAQPAGGHYQSPGGGHARRFHVRPGCSCRRSEKL